MRQTGYSSWLFSPCSCCGLSVVSLIWCWLSTFLKPLEKAPLCLLPELPVALCLCFTLVCGTQCWLGVWWWWQQWRRVLSLPSSSFEEPISVSLASLLQFSLGTQETFHEQVFSGPYFRFPYSRSLSFFLVPFFLFLLPIFLAGSTRKSKLSHCPRPLPQAFLPLPMCWLHPSPLGCSWMLHSD